MICSPSSDVKGQPQQIDEVVEGCRDPKVSGAARGPGVTRLMHVFKGPGKKSTVEQEEEIMPVSHSDDQSPRGQEQEWETKTVTWRTVCIALAVLGMIM